MKNAVIVLKHEFITLVNRRSFILTLVLMPLISLAIFWFVSVMNKNEETNPITNFFAPQAEQTVDGYVDQSGLIVALPVGYEKTLLPYANVTKAEEAMAQGVIDGYYVIPKDYLTEGKLQYIQAKYDAFAGLENSGGLEYVINFNLLQQNQELADRVQNPYNLEVKLLSGESQRDPENMLTFFLPYIVTFLFYFMIFGTASLMLNSVTSEKQNRVLEIIMTSITPMEMLTGKMIALGLVGLLQTVVWSSTGLLILRLSGRSFSLPAAFQLDASILLWGVLFFVLGYAVYASLMAGVGALVPNLREASQATFVIMIPLIVPLMLVSSLIRKPNSALSLFFSLFPLTSPVSMMTRLAATQVPIWQVILALGLLSISAYFIVRAAAGIFRAQNLLSGQKFKTIVFLHALLGKL